MSILWIHGGCPAIPQLSDEALEALVKKLRPCYLDEDKNLTYMQVPSLRSAAFTWDPQKLVVAAEWREVARVETHHRCGYIGFFKPSIAETLAWAPKHVLEEANAFVTLADDTLACYSDGDGHRTVTIFYSAVPLDDEQNPYFENTAVYLDYKYMKEA